jgi:hypothetical protein
VVEIRTQEATAGELPAAAADESQRKRRRRSHRQQVPTRPAGGAQRSRANKVSTSGDSLPKFLVLMDGWMDYVYKNAANFVR